MLFGAYCSSNGKVGDEYGHWASFINLLGNLGVIFGSGLTRPSRRWRGEDCRFRVQAGFIVKDEQIQGDNQSKKKPLGLDD